MFEHLVNEAAARFNLPAESTSNLLRSLLSLITNEKTGGAEGFVNLFRHAGLGDVITSWFGSGEGRAITAPQLESALGSASIDKLAGSAGLSRAVIMPALTYLLPKVIGLLTPRGQLPSNDSIRARVSSFLEPPAARARIASPPEVMPREIADVDRTGERAGWAWLPWAAVALLALAALLWLRPSAGTVEPQLTLRNRDGRITYSGLVRDEATRTRIVDSLRSTFGAGNIEGDLRVDPDVKRAEWLPRVDELMAALNKPGTEFSLKGNDIRVGGWLSAADREAVTNTLGGIFGGATIGSLGDAAADAVRAANVKAVSALRAVGTAGVTSTSDLVNALNMSIINFPSGSAEIPADAADVIQSSAEALKRAPDGHAIEIGGHTDSSGDAARNLALSQARADAVRDALIAAGVSASSLVARGYGDTRPRADNASEYGRFQNRRIEYSTVPVTEKAGNVR